ncbi:MAG TPA: carboxypeptidase-like regulatory domain-containing protein, partial [Longimicrobiales bacterium]|nr:carboxypeptidase-like regulatory domain-containing protein [Longimicrobiales bacterium]
MSIPLLAALLVLSAPQRADDPPAPRGPTVEGVIRGVEEGRRIPVPYAIVEVLGPDGRRTVMADSVGRYRAEPVPPGLRRLRAGGIGWETIEVDVLVPS